MNEDKIDPLLLLKTTKWWAKIWSNTQAIVGITKELTDMHCSQEELTISIELLEKKLWMAFGFQKLFEIFGNEEVSKIEIELKKMDFDWFKWFDISSVLDITWNSYFLAINDEYSIRIPRCKDFQKILDSEKNIHEELYNFIEWWKNFTHSRHIQSDTYDITDEKLMDWLKVINSIKIPKVYNSEKFYITERVKAKPIRFYEIKNYILNNFPKTLKILNFDIDELECFGLEQIEIILNSFLNKAKKLNYTKTNMPEITHLQYEIIWELLYYLLSFYFVFII